MKDQAVSWRNGSRGTQLRHIPEESAGWIRAHTENWEWNLWGCLQGEDFLNIWPVLFKIPIGQSNALLLLHPVRWLVWLILWYPSNGTEQIFIRDVGPVVSKKIVTSYLCNSLDDNVHNTHLTMHGIYQAVFH